MKPNYLTFSPKNISLLLIFFVMVFNVVSAYAQLSEDKYRVALCYNFLKNVTWENHQSKSDKPFVLGVLSTDKSLVSTFQSLKSKNVLGRTVQVQKIGVVAKVKNYQLDALYAGVEFSAYTKKILEILEGKQTLLISDQSMDQKSVMINILQEEDNLSFEVNKANMAEEGIKSGDQLLLLGGTEIDVRVLFKESQEQLEKEKEKVSDKEKMIEGLQSEIVKHMSWLEETKDELAKQQKAILEQSSQITDQLKLISNQQLIIEERNAQVNDYVSKLDSLNENINERNNYLKIKEALIEEQDTKYQNQLEMYDKGKRMLDDQQIKIQQQEKVLSKQSTKIDFQQNLIYIVAAFLILALGFTFFINRSLALQRKSKRALQSAHNELHLKKDEVESQNEELKQQQEEILMINETLEDQRLNLSIKNNSITKSIDYANSIQLAIFPSIKFMRRVFPRHFLIYKPKDIVSGDFYFVEQKAHCKILIVADCTGHGVPGAFMSLLGINILNYIITSKKIDDPAEILNELRVEVKQQLSQEESLNADGMDLGICKIEEQPHMKQKVTFSGSKNRIYHVDSVGKLTTYDSNRILIGGAKSLNKASFTNEVIYLESNDMLYMATDGFQDQANSERRSFSSKKLKEIFCKIYSFEFDVQKNALETVLNSHQGETEQRDDITLIGVRL